MDAFATSALPYHAKDFALANGIGDAIHGVDHTVPRVEASLQVFNPEEFVHSFILQECARSHLENSDALC